MMRKGRRTLRGHAKGLRVVAEDLLSRGKKDAWGTLRGRN